jgi:SAM-dependent methyltransferase
MGRVTSSLKKVVRRMLSSPPVKSVLYAPAVRRSLGHSPLTRNFYRVWDRLHPFDLQYGIETTGILTPDEITSDRYLASQVVCYAGSQPSIVRAALSALGPVDDYAFLDLGCGKGRAAIVATEFPFREVVGVDLSTDLTLIARSNADSVARRFPDRPRVTIAQANVLNVPLPAGKLVLFAYHPFHAEILEGVIGRLEAALAADTPHIFFVYDDPYHAEVLDASPAFTRYHARQIPYDESEMGFGLFTHDAVVTWQSVRGAVLRPYPDANRRVIVVNGKAELADH